MFNSKHIAKEMVIVFSLLLSGCDRSSHDGPIPEVTRENCTPEIADGIKNLELRRKFVDKCSQLITVKRSPPRGW